MGVGLIQMEHILKVIFKTINQKAKDLGTSIMEIFWMDTIIKSLYRHKTTKTSILSLLGTNDLPYIDKCY